MLRGEIDRHEFTERMTRCEFVALTQTRAFLGRELGPRSLLQLDDHPLTAHLLHASRTLDEQVRKYRRLGYDMSSYFAGVYDREIEPRMIRAN